MLIVGYGHLVVIGGILPSPMLVFIRETQEDLSGLKSLSSWGVEVIRLRVVHKWIYEQLDRSLHVLCP